MNVNRPMSKSGALIFVKARGLGHGLLVHPPVYATECWYYITTYFSERKSALAD